MAEQAKDETSKPRMVTCTAPVNIAVIKYWGKRDEKLILPVNSSLSVTLDELRATTTVALSTDFPRDRVWLNGREEAIDNPRLQQCLAEIRSMALQTSSLDTNLLRNGHVHISSENNFPTAAGLASSAAGYACLVATLAQAYSCDSNNLSRIARQGSGSACRSMYGGFVKWDRGQGDDGKDSIAVQVAPESHWPEMHALILVVSAKKKPVSSTAGMKLSVETSSLLQHRAEVIVPQRIREMEDAIRTRDFQSFGKLTMQDSNQFHAVCLDTYPPIVYLNHVSHAIIQLISQYNSIRGEVCAAYSFDAGPNAVIFAPRDNIPQLLSLVQHFFPPSSESTCYVRGIPLKGGIPKPDESLVEKMTVTTQPQSLQYIIHTKVGPGPCVLLADQHLLDSSGNPINRLLQA